MVTDERRSFHAARLLTVVRKPPRALSRMCTFESVQLGLEASYSINDFMQKALPPDFSNSEVSTMTGSSPSFCNVSPRLLVRWEVM